MFELKFQFGEYVVTNYRAFAPVSGKAYDVWRVYMRSQFDNPQRIPLFESPRKREAIKHARMLERERVQIEKALAGDPIARAENYKRVEQLKRKEQES